MTDGLRLLGIAGRKGSGKDTLGTYLSHFGYECLAFADPIKSGLEVMLGLDVPRAGACKEEPVAGWDVSFRELMQTLGDWGRTVCGEAVWVDLAARRLARVRLYDGADRVVFTDVRRANEADWIRAQGGLVLHLARPGRAWTDPHPTEAGVAPVEGEPCLVNDGTIAQLYTQLQEALEPGGWL